LTSLSFFHYRLLVLFFLPENLRNNFPPPSVSDSVSYSSTFFCRNLEALFFIDVFRGFWIFFCLVFPISSRPSWKLQDFFVWMSLSLSRPDLGLFFVLLIFFGLRSPGSDLGSWPVLFLCWEVVSAGFVPSPFFRASPFSWWVFFFFG